MLKRTLFFTGIAMGALGAAQAVGDILLSPRKAPETAPARAVPQEEAFPESRFGQPPSKPFAVRAVEEMETDDEALYGDSNLGRANRAPAGLVYGDPKDVGTVQRPKGPRVARATPMDNGPAADTITATAIQRKGVQEVALIAGDLGFFPKTVFVSRDVPVRLYVTGASKSTLCIMMDSFQVRKQVHSQKIEEITFTPNVPGQYRFYCPVNGSEGVMIVKELAS